LILIIRRSSLRCRSSSDKALRVVCDLWPNWLRLGKPSFLLASESKHRGVERKPLTNIAPALRLLSLQHMAHQMSSSPSTSELFSSTIAVKSDSGDPSEMRVKLLGDSGARVTRDIHYLGVGAYYFPGVLIGTGSPKIGSLPLSTSQLSRWTWSPFVSA
jgi:hypothetical protein